MVSNYQKSLFHSKGTALFMALLMVVLVSSLAIFLVRSQRIDIKRTQLMLTSEQAFLYSQGVLGWAIGTLKTDLSNPNIKWPITLPPTTIANGQGKISGILQDGQALFNINNLANNKPSDVDSFKNLLKATGIPEAQHESLIQSIIDWITIPKNAASAQKYAEQYAKTPPFYAAPHAPMVTISELRMVLGMTAEIYNQLLPYIIALPPPTAFVAQHASPAMLQALGIPPEKITPASNSNPSSPRTQNQYYLLRTDVYLLTQHFISYNLLSVEFTQTEPQEAESQEANSNQNLPSLPKIVHVWQSFGTL